MFYLPHSTEPDGDDASKNSTLPIIAGLVNDLSTRRFVSLPLWTTLQVRLTQYTVMPFIMNFDLSGFLKFL